MITTTLFARYNETLVVTNRQKSHLQTSKMQKIIQHNPWNVDFKIREKQIFLASYRRKIPNSNKGILKHWFHESAEIAFPVTNMQKICSHETWYPWNVDFTTRQTRIFRPHKRRKFLLSLRGTLKHWFHESVETAFSVSKLRKICSNEAWYMRKICSHGTWYPWNVDFTTQKNYIFWSQIWRKFPHSLWWHFQVAKMRKICTHEAWYHWNLDFTTGRNRIFRPRKWKLPHSMRGTLNDGFANRQKSHLQTSKMQKISQHEPRYPWNVVFTIREK